MRDKGPVLDPVEETRWSIRDAAFAKALEYPEAERQNWLRREFSDDPEGLSDVMLLLQEEADSREYFDTLLIARDSVAEDLSIHLEDAVDDPRIGAHYGPWRVLRRIGSGGSSVVYEACRSDGRYEQSVALKVMHGGMHNGDVVRHFLRERRILSGLDHPGIVRILDGGETATGAPWFTMDLVSGKRITDYCEDKGLGLNARLALMVQVADAVQSAHSRLIVHRDIKPDNIIVSEEGRTRLLDFGVSSLFSGEEADETGRAMTPGYASPEQLRLDVVTTASDIWQLGHVLRELCEPLEPLSKDLRAVIDKALSEEIGGRYESASSFAEDLRRLMEGRAPLARMDSHWEAAVRFARRNKALTFLSILFIFGLIGWGVTLSVHAREIERERAIAIAAADRAERGRGVLLNLFRRLDPLERDGVPATDAGTDALVDLTLTDVRERLPDDPLLQAELVGWAARVRQRGENLDEARMLAQEGVDVLQESGDTSSTIYAAALAYLGHLDVLREEGELGRDELSRALDIATVAPLSDSPAFEAVLSAAWASEADWQRQKELLEQALTRALATGSVNGEIEVRSGLGRALSNLGEMEEAEAQIRQALALTEKSYGPDHPRMALPLSDLGRLLFRLGRPEEAVAAHQKAVDIAAAAYGSDSGQVLMHRNNLSIVLSANGQSDKAISEFQEIVNIREHLNGEDSLAVGEVLQNLASEQSASGMLDDALISLERAERIFKEKLPEESPRRAFPALTRSAVLLELERYDAAEAAAREAFGTLSRTLPEGHYATEIARCRMGLAELGIGNREAAHPLLAQALSALENQQAAPAAYVAACKAAGRMLGIPEQASGLPD